MTTRPCPACGALIGTLAGVGLDELRVNPEFVQTYMAPHGGPTSRTLVTERGSVVRFPEVDATFPRAQAVEGWVPHYQTCDWHQTR